MTKSILKEGHEALSELEKEAFMDAGLLWNKMAEIVGLGPSREADLREIIYHIHGIQRAISMNALARCYPDQYRAMGGKIGSPEYTTPA